jgi:hypothetical protein
VPASVDSASSLGVVGPGDKTKPDPDHQSSQGLHACAASNRRNDVHESRTARTSRIGLIVIDLCHPGNYAESQVG